MTNYQTFYLDKTEQTFGDTLTAFGLARILQELLEWQAGAGIPIVTLQEDGQCYRITCEPALSVTTIEQYSPKLMPAMPIKTLKNSESLPDALQDSAINYEFEKERTTTFFAAKTKGGDAERPSTHWDTYRAINPAALPGYNGLILDWWRVHDNPQPLLLLLLELFSTQPNDYDKAQATWKTLDKAQQWGIKAGATAQQLYNPEQGKGQNKPKADGLSIGNVDNFWLVEWLKLVGFYEGAFTRTVRGAKDRKSFVIAPREVTFSAHRAIMSAFISTMQVSETSAKFDIFAAIRYTDAMLKYYFPSDNPYMLEVGWEPSKQVSGFYTAFYKDLGNAVATMNIAFIGLPGWVQVASTEEAEVYKMLLGELEQFTRQFDETHSDAFTLLQHLRDFISGDDLKAFFQATNAFPSYLMGMRERGKFAGQLTTHFIERLVMNTEPKLSKIVQDEGFQNIAYAIRQSTVTAQYRKKQGDRKYDVRYGLGQQLVRKSRYPADFIAELGEFLHLYNAENAQVMETRPKPYRRSIQTSDIESVVALIDEFGSETVAKLLIAYGYARLTRDPEVEQSEEEQE